MALSCSPVGTGRLAGGVIQEVSAGHSIHLSPVGQWKRRLLDGAGELFAGGKDGDLPP